MITITLEQIRAHSPCADGWKKVRKANDDKPFPVSSILDSNGLADTLWALRCLPEYDALWRKFASWCALENIEKIKPYCSADGYDLVTQWLETNDPSLRESALSAAWSALSAAWSALSALSAAWAAWSALSALSAAWSAWSAAWSALSAAESAESARQSEKLRAILDAGQWV